MSRPGRHVAEAASGIGGGLSGRNPGACRAGTKQARLRPISKRTTIIRAAGTNAAAIGMEKLGQVGVLYHGLEVLGGGAILVSLILAAIAASMIDRAFVKAAAFALAGAALTFFGCMHSEAIGIGRTPLVALSYLGVAVLLYASAKHATAGTKTAPAYEHEHPGGVATAT